MKFSVITVCRNDLAGLRKTLASLKAQSAREFEHWVIDGGSTDGTREFLEQHPPDPRFHFLTEPDGGIYDAMNKGVARAKGDFVWFLNSGDTCADTRTLELILRELGEDAPIDVLYGKVWVKSAYGLRSVGAPVTARDFQVRMPVCHQGVIYRRSLLRESPYPLEYRIISDWIVTQALFARGVRTRFLDQPLAVYDLTGFSSRSPAAALREKLRQEKPWSGKARVLAFYGGQLLALWVAKKTGAYYLYKKWQHSGT